jgi:hypothetical protein
VPIDPRRRAALLENRRDVRVDEDVGHRSAERCVAARTEVREERVEFLVRLPDVCREFVGVRDRCGVAALRELVERRGSRTRGRGLAVLSGHDLRVRRGNALLLKSTGLVPHRPCRRPVPG